MKKLLTLLLTTTISFSCLADDKTEYAKYHVNELFSIPAEELPNYKKMENYYKNKSCSKAIQIIENSKYESYFLLGFVNGIFEKDLDCLKKQSQDTLKKMHHVLEPALWLTHGDGGAKAGENTIDMVLKAPKNLKENFFVESGEGLALLSGYYYATGDKRVINTMQSIIQKEKEKESDYQETLYFAAEFLKRYDTNWYNQNVKNWMKEKEKIYLVRDKKEAEESAKRAAENERKRAERKKADDELRKMGVDLDGDPNKVGIIMYNPKTGKTQKIN